MSFNTISLGKLIINRNENIKDNQDSKLIYISTTNMLPNKGGVNYTDTDSLNKSGKGFKKGDILVSNIRPYYRKIWQADKDGICSNDVFRFFPKDEKILDKRYLYYLLSDSKFFDYMTTTAKGTKMPRGDKNAIKKYQVLTKKITEQRKISKILSSLDDKIETNNAIIANLEAQAQAIFKSWFVNFEPFQNGEFVESELGMIPEGWEVRRIGKETDLFTGFPFKSKTYVDEGEFVVITIKNITDGSLVLDSVNYIEEKPANLPSEANLKIGDIVFTMTGNVGRVALVNQDKLLQNQRIGKLILTQEEHRAFYYFLLRNENYKSKIINLAHGTAQANLGKVDFGNILIPFNYEVIDDFSKITEAFLKQIVLLNNQNQKLAQIRDTLLPKLMSGEIRVGQDDIEEIENLL